MERSIINQNEWIQKAHETVSNKREEHQNHHHRHAFHLDPVSGWMNDPNGLIFFNNQYHVFFQYYPFESKNGPKYWGHFRSGNLVDWESLPPALAPGEEYDRDGCYSGSAVENNGELTLIYTGHSDQKSPKEVQCIATSKDGIHFAKAIQNPVIDGPLAGFSEDFRDPKVWRHEGQWYMIVGNNEAGYGQVLLYSSSDLLNWHYENVLLKGNEEQGFMWECPDLIQLGEHHVLILSPEGMDGVKHQSIYIVGWMDYVSKKFIPHHEGKMDFGTDFYAPQTFTDGDGTVIMYGWMNLWESSMPTQENGWVGSMTIPRVLSLNDDLKLIQTSADALKSLRKSKLIEPIKLNEKEENLATPLEFGEIVAKFHCLEGNCRSGLKLRCSEDDMQYTEIGIDVSKKTLYVDRAHSGEGDESRLEAPIHLNSDACVLHIFLDRSSLEIFADGGETIITTRIYPDKSSQGIRIFSDTENLAGEITIWELEDKMKEMK